MRSGDGVIRREKMGETEIEEGEACYYQSCYDDGGFDDPTIDPDVALSYIDEKLQNVLGHFQKDFEGGVSAENLGAKFGGYGSFLPTYQRSPAWTHPRTPSKVPNCTEQFPNNMHMEDGHESVASTSHIARLGPASVSVGSLPAHRTLPLDDKINCHGYTSNDELTNTSYNGCDKNLKVRLKVGSDNLSSQKKSEIYSGLGLDVSPSSSTEGSPTDSGQTAPDESPTSILQMMTSFPLLGNLLSPLPYDLMCLVEKEKLRGKPTKHNGSQESSVTFVNGFNSAKVDKQASEEKKVEPVVKKSLSAESKKGSVISSLTKKEAEMDDLACEELVSNALRLPLLSNTDCNAAKSRKGTISKDEIKVESFSGLLKEESSHPASIQKKSRIVKPEREDVLVDKIFENDEAFSDNCDSQYTRKGGIIRGEQVDVSAKKCTGPPEQKAVQKATSSGKDRAKMTLAKETSISGGRKKSKGNQSPRQLSSQHVETLRGSLKNDPYSMAVSRDGTYANDSLPQSDKVNFEKDYGKVKERYKDFFGELDIEEEDSDMDLEEEEKPCDDRLKDSTLLKKSALETNCASQEGLNRNKTEQTSSSVYPRAGSHMAPLPGSGSVYEEDNWVACDKCQKWRLLPPGRNPDSLPEKWLCSMLDWLPGMNQCSFSEEETKNALFSLYYAPANQSDQHIYAGGVPSRALAGNSLHLDQNNHHLGSHAVPTDGRIRRGSKAVPHEPKQDGPTQSSNSSRKNFKKSTKSRNSNGAKQTSAMNGAEFQDSGRSSSLVGEKHRRKQKENIADSRQSKIKSKRETDPDCSRASKKVKTDGQLANGDLNSDLGAAVLKPGHKSSSGLSVSGSGKDRRKYDDCSKGSKGLFRTHENQIQTTLYDGSSHKRESRDDAKKRKSFEFQDAQIGHHLQGSRVDVDACDTEHMKEKKAKLSRPLVEEAYGSRGSAAADTRDIKSQDGQLRALDVVDSSKRDFGHVQASAAATSSSSKVSGSHKIKPEPQEVRGSPVESVSSSPMRILKRDKLSSTRRELDVIDGFKNAAILFSASPKKCSDGEDDRESFRSGTLRKDESLIDTRHKSLQSSVIERDLVCSLGNEGNSRVVKNTVKKGHIEERGDENPSHENGSRSRKSGKGSSSRSKDKMRSSRSEHEKANPRFPDSSNQYVDNAPSEEKLRVGRSKVPEKSLLSSVNIEKNSSSSKREASEKLPSESLKKDCQAKYSSHDGSDGRIDAKCTQNLNMDHDNEIFSKRLLSDKVDLVDDSGRGKSHSLPPSGGCQNETATLPLPIPGSQKENAGNNHGDETLKAPKQIKKAEYQNGNHTSSSTQSATNAIREGKGLKHLADRLKNSGKNLESTGLYFQAALKFLHGASLLESSSSENNRNGDMVQSMTMYSSTAKLCEFCGHEYEKSKEMAAAALAYKCTEVAYLKVVYSSHHTASRDRHELQTALQIVPTGESPSSSASDLDNLNNPAAVDKIALAKGVSSPQVAANHVIAARNRPNFVRLLNFAQDVNLAMEASRKSQNAFAAFSLRQEEAHLKDGISSVKSALDFNFQDVEGLVRLVRLAMEAISR